MIEAGEYTAKADGFEFGRIPNTGTEFVRVHFVIAKTNQRIAWDGWLTDAAIDRTLESLSHCGWDGRSLSDPRGIGTKECEIVIDHERDELSGKIFARVQWVNQLGGRKLSDNMKLSQRDVANLNRKFDEALRKHQTR